MWAWFWAIVGVLGSLVSVALLVYLQWRGHAGHEREEAARAHFDRTGRWPDETTR